MEQSIANSTGNTTPRNKSRAASKSESTKKNKKELKLEKHHRLQEYLDAKRLQQELDYIEGWV
jgi:hypothetical protein